MLNHPEKRAKYDRFGFEGLQAGDAPYFRDVGDILQAFGDIFGEGLFGDLWVSGDAAAAKGPTSSAKSFSICAKRPAAFQSRSNSSGTRHATRAAARGEAGHAAGEMLLLRRQRPSRPVQRFLLPANALSGVPGQRTRGPRALPGLPRPGLSASPRRPQNRHPARRGQRNPPANQRRRRAAPAGGQPGDCYCIIRVKEHPLFHREGADLICQVPISYSQAALGFADQSPYAQRRGAYRRSRGHTTGRGLHAARARHA